MTTKLVRKSIVVTQQQADFIQEIMEAGQFESESECVRAMLSRLQNEWIEESERLEEELIRGLESPSSGRQIPEIIQDIKNR